MKKIKYILPLLLTVVLLFFAFRQISWKEMLNSFGKANYFWIVVSGILGLMSHLSRAYRWNLLLKSIGHSPTLAQSFWAVMSGYFMNFLFIRAGEITRCGALERMADVPIDKGFGTVLLERLIDLMMTAVLILILLVLELDHFRFLLMQFFGIRLKTLLPFVLIGVILMVVSVFLMWRMYLRRDKIRHWKVYQKFRQIGRNVLIGLTSIRAVPQQFQFWFHTCLIWFLYYLMGYVLFFCFIETENLDAWFGYILLVTGTIGMSAPVQGGFGAYHLLVGTIFGLRNMSAEQGLILATFMHTVQTIFLILFGGLSILMVSQSWFNKKKHLDVEHQELSN
ncbi:MAG: UPF0104 family protein [Cytophagia bacterium]|nr:MAG: UPF0104 family protein [Cytophagia bacterium]TAG42973.1 MAG: UPF0104 family protein [Cytophagia bacterium]